MKVKRSYKNPYHQTQSELAEWLALFARDHSTTQVADALVERYPERTSGDPKTDRRLAKEAICTVNPNDSRNNAEKWAKQYGLMQANYLSEMEKCHRQLESKFVTALSAVFDNLDSTILALSPKEQIAHVPKALLTMSQTVRNVKVPPTQAEQVSPEDAEAEERAQTLASIDEFKNRRRANKARDMLWQGKSFDEITTQTHVDEDQIKNDLARQRVEEGVIGMKKSGLNREEIQQRSKLPYAYIDSLIDHQNDRRMYRFGLQEEERPTDYEKTRAQSKNGNDEDLGADSEAARNLN